MLEKLTSDQEKLLAQTRDKWINLALHSAKDVTLDEVNDGIKWLYGLISLPKPRIVICEGYVSQKLAMNAYLNGEQFAITPGMASMTAQEVIKHAEKTSGKQFQLIEHGHGLGWWSGWLAFYDFFEQIGIAKHESFDRWKNLLSAGIWCMGLFDDTVFICKLPTKVIKAERGGLHSLNEAAVQWRDGFDNYAIDRVMFDFTLWQAIRHRNISAQDIMKLQNIEQRTVVMRHVGYENVLKDLKTKTLDICKFTHPRTNRPMEYEVLETNLADDNETMARFVKLIDFSTDRVMFIRVDPRTNLTRTCKGAIAWTFNMGEGDYEPKFET